MARVINNEPVEDNAASYLSIQDEDKLLTCGLIIHSSKSEHLTMIRIDLAELLDKACLEVRLNFRRRFDSLPWIECQRLL